MTISLCPSIDDDAEDVMRLHLPPEFFVMRRETLPGRVETLRKGIAAGHIPTVAYDAAGLVGVAASGASEDPEAPAPLELRMIYTLVRVHGSGAGQLLLDAFIGADAAFLWVREDNPRAQAFYAKNGFVVDGAQKLMPPEWHKLPEVRMAGGVVQRASATLAG